jgi:large subunit ribosomal protein L25
MAEEFTLEAWPRQPGHPRRDRREGFVPAVVYGHGFAPRALRVQARALDALLVRGGAHHLVRIRIAGEAEPHTVVVKEVQRHPVTRRVEHVDFQAVAAGERIHAEVPLHLVGEAEVVRAGAVLQIGLHSVRVACLPQDLPERLDVPVAGLSPGQMLTVRDLRAPQGVHILNDPDEVVVHVLLPRAAAAEASTGGGDAAKPAS